MAPFGPNAVPESRWVESKSTSARVFILSAGVIMNILLTIVVLSSMSYVAGNPYRPAIIDSVATGMPAATAGFAKGDVIVAVNGSGVRSWNEAVSKIAPVTQGTITLEVQRGSERVSKVLTPQIAEATDSVTGSKYPVARVGIVVRNDTIAYRKGLGVAIASGGRDTWNMATSVGAVLRGLVLGQVSPKNLAGPITIARTSVKAAQGGAEFLWYLIAFLSLNIGIINLVPIPVLDGGQILLVLAERIASQCHESVLVVDRREHIGGNAFDHLDAAGVLVHRYGPHIFHTNSAAIFTHLSRFTEWRAYEHRVLAQVKSPATGEPMLVPMPINLDTINSLYGLRLTEDEVEAWLAARAETVERVRTSEDVVVGKVGRELYELFFRGYTRKQWALDPSELDKSVTSRVPTRTNRDGRYFTDSFQCMPREGYTAMFRKMLDHPNITVRTGMDFTEARRRFSFRRLIWTGPVDEYFGFRFGRLPYRSLTFRHETLDREWALPTGTVNHPDEATPFTRVSEYKWMTGQEHPKTSVTYEFPSAEGDPYYPIPRPENAALYKRYEALADAERETWFVGRLATYRYYNMDQVVGQALSTFERIEKTVPRAVPANDDGMLKRVSAGD